MSWQPTPLFLPLLTAALTCLALGVFAWRHRTVPAASGFVLLMAASAWWSLFYALYRASADLAGKLLWAQATQAGAIAVPLAWFLFVLRYTRSDRWLTPARVALVSLVPLLTLALLLTNPLHHQFWSRFELVVRDGRIAVNSVNAWGFWLHVAYSWALLSLSVFLLVLRVLRSAHLHRRQAALTLLAVLVPWTGNVLHLSGMVRFPANPMPFLFTLGGIAFAWAIFRLRFLDIVPVARETLVEEMTDAVVVLGEDGRVLDLNAAARALFGVEPEQAVGRPAARVLTPLAGVLPRAEDTQPLQTEVRLGAGGGVYDVRVSPLLERGQGPTGHLLVLRDISERRQREAALALQTAYLEHLFQASSEAIALLDREERVLEVNPAFVRTFGYRPEEAAGRPINELIVPEELWEEGVALTRQVAGGAGFQVETVRRRHDGTRLAVAASGIPVLLGGRQVATYAIYRDVTARQRMDEERAELLAREREARTGAEQAVRARDSILATVSHDLRSPLTAIHLTAGALLSTPSENGLSDMVRERVGWMLRASEQMERLIHDLLEVARIEAGELAVLPSAAKADALVRDAVALGAPLAREREVRLEARVPEAQVRVSADADRIHQVFSNLLGNALKFTPPGGTVEVGGAPEGDGVRFWVRDTGSGIPAEHLPRIFDRFWQAERRGRRGAGLGLAIARGIVEAHGGRIWVESAAGEGTTVSFTLAREG